MADTFTTNYNLTKPEPGTAGWDGKLNADLDAIDAEIKNREDETATKATLVSNPTENNLAALNAAGDLVDSGRDIYAVMGNFYAHEAAVPDMSVVLEPGHLMYGGIPASQPQQTTANIANPVTDPYIVRIVIDKQTGAYSIVYGQEDPVAPVAPTIPAGKLPVTRFEVDIATNTTAITDAMMTDERPLVADKRESFILAADNAHLTVVDGIATDVFNYTIPKNTGRAGGTFRLTVAGEFLVDSAANNHTFYIGVVFGSTVISSIGTNVFGATFGPSIAARSFKMVIDIAISSSVLQSAVGTLVISDAGSSATWNPSSDASSTGVDGRDGILRYEAIAEDLATDLAFTVSLANGGEIGTMQFTKRSAVLEYLP